GSTAIRIPCAPAGTPFTFASEAYAGSYVVSVTGHPGSSDLPTETFRPGISVDVSAPITDLAVDVTAHAVSGAVTVNGAAPPACTGAAGALWGEINAYEPTKKYNFNLDVPCAPGPFAFSELLYPGSYHVTVSINGGESLLVARALEIAGPVENLVLDAAAVE